MVRAVSPGDRSRLRGRLMAMGLRAAGEPQGGWGWPRGAWALVAALCVLPGLGCNLPLSFRDPAEGGAQVQVPGDGGADVTAPDARADLPIGMDVDTGAQPDAPIDIPIDAMPDLAVDTMVDLGNDLPRDLGNDLPRDLPTGPIVCNVEADCRLGLHCLTSTHACVECVADGNCPSRCNTTLHRCVECNPATMTTDCPTADTTGEHVSACSTTTFRCNLGCDDSQGNLCPARFSCGTLVDHQCTECGSDADCVGSPRGPRCNLADHICAQCAMASQCSPTAPICDPTSGRCVQCQSQTNCPATAPNCAAVSFTCSP